MNIKSKKGFALAFAIIFAIVLTASILGVWAYVAHLMRETKVVDVRSKRGYYAAMAGLRYARVLLRDPDGLVFDGYHNCLIEGDELGGDFFTDIDINPDDLTVTITEWHTGCGWPEGEYKIIATYSP